MKEKNITSYKGFDKNLKCRGFQYKVGEEYEENGKIAVCMNGFHACKNPFDVLDYYGSINNRFCVVEQSGTLIGDGIKTASSHINIKAEIGWDGLFKAGVEWLKEVTNPTEIINETKNSQSYCNDNGGDYVQIGSSGDSAKIGSSGDYAKIGSSGNFAQIGSSGNFAQMGSSGDSAKIGSSGYFANIGNSGNSVKIGSSGYSAKIGSSGDSVKIGSSGDSVKIGSSGDYAKIGSSGDYAQIGSSGYSAKIGSSGDYAQIYSNGENSVICCAGRNSVAKAKQGSWITLAEWECNEEKKLHVPKCVKTEYVDGERIKADTWYKLVDGEFKKVEMSTTHH